MYKEDVLALLALIILIAMWAFTSFLADSEKSEKDVYDCPICEYGFEFDDNSSKIICDKCGYIMIFEDKE